MALTKVNATNIIDGVLPVANGGTGATTQAGAAAAVLPSQTGQAGKYLATDGTNTSWDQINISTADITGTLPVANGGTGQTTANAGFNALAPSQTGNSGKYLTTDGTNTSWGTVTAPTPAAVSDQNNTSTGYFDLPAGTTAQRPGTPAAGMMRYNSTTGYSEVYQNGAWISFGITTYPITTLVVAGGGGGGGAQVAANYEGGGGGGAGGYIATSVFAIGQTVYTITVGAGGAGGGASRSANGSNSVFAGNTAIGGGAGAGRLTSPSDYAALSGGSGGGGQNYGSQQAGAAGTTGQGFAGGNGASHPNVTGGNGGGGGSGGTGGNASGTTGGNGGAGTANSITGSSVTYAGGGGGGGGTPGSGQGGGGNGSAGSGVNGTAGTANTGGGGGGGLANNPATLGGNGGSGVVILSIPTSFYSGVTTGSPSVTTVGSNTILTFTSSGSYTA